MKNWGSFVCQPGMDDLGLEDEVEVDFDGRQPPAVFPCEDEPQDSLAEQTVSYLIASQEKWCWFTG